MWMWFLYDLWWPAWPVHRSYSKLRKNRGIRKWVGTLVHSSKRVCTSYCYWVQFTKIHTKEWCVVLSRRKDYQQWTEVWARSTDFVLNIVSISCFSLSKQRGTVLNHSNLCAAKLARYYDWQHLCGPNVHSKMIKVRGAILHSQRNTWHKIIIWCSHFVLLAIAGDFVGMFQDPVSSVVFFHAFGWFVLLLIICFTSRF